MIIKRAVKKVQRRFMFQFRGRPHASTPVQNHPRASTSAAAGAVTRRLDPTALVDSTSAGQDHLRSSTSAAAGAVARRPILTARDTWIKANL